MPEGRPAIPASVERDVLLEAGYGCVMPRCGWPQVERAHLIDYAKSQDHSFGNLIALCSNHHAMHTKGDIKTLVLRILKARLAIENKRYNHCEIRWLDIGVHRPDFIQNGGVFSHPAALAAGLRQLVADGYIEQIGPPSRSARTQDVEAIPFRFTANGKKFVKAWGEADAHLLPEVVNGTYEDLDRHLRQAEGS